MRERQLENLLKIVAEIEELERRASADSSRATPAAPETRLVAVFRRVRKARRARRLVVPFAAAACLALLLMPTSQPQSARDALPVSVEYCPGVALASGVRVDRFQPTASEHCSVLALFRTYHDECRCLAWRIYEWEDGRPLASLDPEEVLDIALEVTDAPPVEQLLVVAVARRPADLPADFDQTVELLDCLNEVSPPDERQAEASAYASAVQACLGSDVTVVPQSFFVE